MGPKSETCVTLPVRSVLLVGSLYSCTTYDLVHRTFFPLLSLSVELLRSCLRES